jgi:aryl-alcohol dehydrogenase-like predicted oxidoreductase
MDKTIKVDNLAINRLGFGAMRLAGETAQGASYQHDNAISVLRRAVELGVNFIDTADVYGPGISESLIHEALHPYEGLVIATKGGLTTGGGPGMRVPNGKPDYLRSACEASLRRLSLERIQLYQLHRPDPKVPFEMSVRALFDLQSEGKVAHVGLSNVTVDQVRSALEFGPIFSVQNHYNVLDREHEAVLELCGEEGIAFVAYFPGGGSAGVPQIAALQAVAEKYAATTRQIGLAWLFQRSPAIVSIPGTRSVAHLEENMRARDLSLDREDVAQLDALTG